MKTRKQNDDKPDLYIDVIRYAISKQQTFKLGEIYDHLKLDETQISLLKEQVRAGNILFSTRHPSVIEDKQDGREFPVSASAEDRFRLLDYDELREARSSSKSAMYWAIGAITVSIILGVLSMYQSYIQNSSNDKASAKLLKELQLTNRRLAILEKSNSTSNSSIKSINAQLLEQLQEANRLIAKSALPPEKANTTLPHSQSYRSLSNSKETPH